MGNVLKVGLTVRSEHCSLKLLHVDEGRAVSYRLLGCDGALVSADTAGKYSAFINKGEGVRHNRSFRAE